MIIKNISVYQTFTQQFEIKDVLIKNGHFAYIADSLSVTNESVIDGTGKWMIPGLIDIHMHIESSMTSFTPMNPPVVSNCGDVEGTEEGIP